MGDNNLIKRREKNLGKNKLKKKRSMGRKIKENFEEYLNDNNYIENENYNGNVPEIQSLLDYFSKYQKSNLKYPRDFQNLDYYIDYLISAFPLFTDLFDRNINSKKFTDDKNKIFKNLNEILKTKIEKLNLEIDKIIRQKEKIRPIISYINYKPNIPPVTMNQFLPPNNNRGENRANNNRGENRANNNRGENRANNNSVHINEWPMLGTGTNVFSNKKSKRK